MKQILFFLAGIIAISFFSCTNSVLPKNIIVFCDLSGSRDSITIEWYKRTIEQNILFKMRPKDRITILPVDDGSVLANKEILTYDFSKHSYANELAGMQADQVELQNLGDTITSVANQFNLSYDKARHERTKFATGTDIFGALKLCQKHLLPTHQNILVFFSDMEHSGSKDEFNLEKNLSQVEIDRYLSDTIKPNLQSVKIVIITGSQDKATKESLAMLEQFWKRYFELCGATVIDYSTMSLMKLDEILISSTKP